MVWCLVFGVWWCLSWQQQRQSWSSWSRLVVTHSSSSSSCPLYQSKKARPLALSLSSPSLVGLPPSSAFRPLRPFLAPNQRGTSFPPPVPASCKVQGAAFPEYGYPTAARPLHPFPRPLYHVSGPPHRSASARLGASRPSRLRAFRAAAISHASSLRVQPPFIRTSSGHARFNLFALLISTVHDQVLGKPSLNTRKSNTQLVHGQQYRPRE